MQIIEKNAGKKIDYELNGSKLSFADGALTLDLARRQRDSTVTLDIMVDSEGSLTTGRGLYYAAQVEIPPTEYDEKIIPAPGACGAGGQRGRERPRRHGREPGDCSAHAPSAEHGRRDPVSLCR